MGLLDEELLQSRISPTPRNPILGLLSDFIAQGYDPRRTQQMQGISKFLMAPEISQTLDRLSYDPSGRSLFTGAGGLGGTTRMRPEALDAALAVAPMAGPAVRLAGRGAVATGRTLGPTAAGMTENFLQQQGLMPGVLPPKRFQGQRLKGMPEAVDVGGRMEQFGTDQRIVDIAQQYMADRGMKYRPQKTYAEINFNRGERIANEYAAMKHDPNDPKTKKAYKALAKETQDQFESLLKAGYKFDFIRGADPYGNPRNAINDLVLNKRMSVFPTESGFGSSGLDVSGNPLLARSELRIANDPTTTYNDLFRAVHDVYGHAKHGVGFRARGEENAFQSHARMYSPEALPAVTSETRGQNSTVNFGPFGRQNRSASPENTIYADQKTGLMLPFTYREGLLFD